MNKVIHLWVLLTSTFFHQKLTVFVMSKNTEKKLHFDIFFIIRLTFFSVHDISKKSLSPDLTYIADVIIWPRFSKPSISTREVIISGFDQKSRFFEGSCRFKYNNFGLVLDIALTFYGKEEKESELHVRVFWRLISSFRAVTGEQLVGGDFLPQPFPYPECG